MRRRCRLLGTLFLGLAAWLGWSAGPDNGNGVRAVLALMAGPPLIVAGSACGGRLYNFVARPAGPAPGRPHGPED